MLRYSGSLPRAVFGLLLLVALQAPASWADSVEGLSAAQVAALEKRVEQRWQALVARDYAAAYAFSTPVYRSVFPKDLYVLQFSYAVERQLTGVEVLNYDAAAAVASVAVRVMSKPVKLTSTASQAVGAVPVTIHERWMLIDGEWWYSADV
ncbi:MAG: hypothetical protein KDI04_16755 [Halieaceae bacterium]|nr:hypothetical protein [Halieaceae bacterium]